MITMRLETQKFNAALRKFAVKSKLSEDKVIRKVAFDLLSNILRPEPYGKHPVSTGRARAAWFPSVVGLGKKFDFESRVKENSQVEIGKKEGRFISKLTGSNKYVEMVNAVDYIMYLEYGWSKTAPLGLVRISMRKMRGKLPKELGKAYRDDWNAIGRGKASAFGSIASTIRDFTEFGD